MSIVKSDEAISVLAVKSQAVNQPMRAFGRGWNPLNNEPHLVSSFGVNEEARAVQGEQIVEPPVRPCAHDSHKLSHSDNKGQSLS